MGDKKSIGSGVTRLSTRARLLPEPASETTDCALSRSPSGEDEERAVTAMVDGLTVSNSRQPMEKRRSVPSVFDR